MALQAHPRPLKHGTKGPRLSWGEEVSGLEAGFWLEYSGLRLQQHRHPHPVFEESPQWVDPRLPLLPIVQSLCPLNPLHFSVLQIDRSSYGGHDLPNFRI